MSTSLSANTQATLLLTAPLLLGRSEATPVPLTPSEYRRLVRHLHHLQRQPADLASSEGDALLEECRPVVDYTQAKHLLARGFLLSQALERWQARAIWVVGHCDEEYPRRLAERLKEDSPPILYGCGDRSILDTGGLAVVGSRNAGAALLDYAQEIGCLTAAAGQTLISGGARGIDQAAMRGALERGGRVAGLLSDSLERAAMNREHRSMLLEGQLVLVSPFDPNAGFHVGHAMQRNKLIYALADAAVVVNSDYGKGGTWAGAVEQLDRLRFVPVYVRSEGEIGAGLEALLKKGARPWPSPHDTDSFAEALSAPPPPVSQKRLEPSPEPRPVSSVGGLAPAPLAGPTEAGPAEELFAKVRELLQQMPAPKTLEEMAAALNMSKGQAKKWLKRLVEAGELQKSGRPARYTASRRKQEGLFGGGDGSEGERRRQA